MSWTHLRVKHSGMARILKGPHSFTCTLRVHPLTEWTMPALPSRPKLVYSFTDPGGMEGWVGHYFFRTHRTDFTDSDHFADHLLLGFLVLVFLSHQLLFVMCCTRLSRLPSAFKHTLICRESSINVYDLLRRHMIFHNHTFSPLFHANQCCRASFNSVNTRRQYAGSITLWCCELPHNHPIVSHIGNWPSLTHWVLRNETLTRRVMKVLFYPAFVSVCMLCYLTWQEAQLSQWAATILILY